MEKLALKIIHSLLKLFFKLEVEGQANYFRAGERVVILSNHQSFLDPVILASILPDKPNFAINTLIAQQPIIKLALKFFKVFRLDPTNPMSAKSLIEFVQEDNKVVIFPEGRITVTGSLMKVYEGPGLVAEKSGAMILPIHIENAQYTKFSRLGGQVRRRWFPKIRVTIFPPFKIESAVAGKNKRADIARKLERIMSENAFNAAQIDRNIIMAVMDAANTHGAKKVIAEDINRKPISYRDLFLRTFLLSNALENKLSGENIGVLLPNSVANLVTFFALHRLSKAPAMLNFSAGVANINNAIKTANIKTILCSRAFVENAELQPVIDAILGADIIYLEDIAKEITPAKKIAGKVISYFPRIIFEDQLHEGGDNTAVILFTSGSEGVPKGVVLSHRNIIANINQAASVIDFSSKDIVLNVLPMFHSFGLGVGTLLPVLCGIKTFLYPSPIHYHIIPEISYAIRATILFGTDTFLTRYGKYAHPYDFFSVRMVLAGAEKLKDSTRQMWFDKFGIRIFEGYGVTETSPVISLNTPMYCKAGTVGRIVPGMEYKIVPVEGINEGGELWVKGANVMQGYMKIDKPAQVQPLDKGWYGTGDIVTVDAEGFIKIAGRAKRFAKIAGEMVSLPMVEEIANKLWADEMLAVVAIKDDKKGEQLVLVVQNKNLKLEDFTKFALEKGLPAIAVPKNIFVSDIPLLGSGKTDFPKLQNLVEAGLYSLN